MWDPNSIAKLSPSGVVEPGFPKTTGGADGDRGVAITPADNHVWVAKSHTNTVLRLDNNGDLLKAITVGGCPTGVAVDANSKVWVTNECDDNVMRIDPNGGEDGLGAVDLTVDLGPEASPYNYSDMTGIVAIGVTSPQGTWSVVEDAGTPGSEWGPIVWNAEAQGSEPPGTEIVMEARAADTESSQSPLTVKMRRMLFPVGYEGGSDVW